MQYKHYAMQHKNRVRDNWSTSLNSESTNFWRSQKKVSIKNELTLNMEFLSWVKRTALPVVGLTTLAIEFRIRGYSTRLSAFDPLRFPKGCKRVECFIDNCILIFHPIQLLKLTRSVTRTSIELSLSGILVMSHRTKSAWKWKIW